MRLLLTCLPYYSHLVPALLPVAEAARRAGHAVAVATAPAMAECIAQAGIEHLPLPNVPTLAELLADPDFAGSPGMPGAKAESEEDGARARARPGRLTLARAGVLAGRFARDVIEAARHWRPEVIMRESNEFGGYLAAERLGLPHAVLDISPLNAHNLPFVLGSLNEQRVELGLDPVDDPWLPNRGLLAALAPEPWYPQSLPARPTRSYRAAEVTTRLDRSFADLPDDRPLILAGLGTLASTLAPETPALLTALVTAFGELRCSAVLAVGPGSAAADWSGPRPPSVRLVPFVPLARLLGAADLFVSHGGFGGVLLAMRAATPMVNLPLLGDQPATSQRVAELGYGLHVGPADARPAVLADTIARVIADSAFRYRIAGMSRRIRTDPDYQVLVDDLAEL